MANQEHLEILVKGVEMWNEWRSKNPNTSPNLKEADLQGINLIKANLCGVNFRKANLRKANLREANLRRSNLIEANLTHANLNKVNLKGADLNAVNLRKANLIQANLNKVNLTHANLCKAYFNNTNLRLASLRFANLNSTNFSGASLNGADLSGANFDGLIIDKKTQLDEKWYIVWEIINYPRTQRNLEGVNLSGSNLNGVNLSEATLEVADLSEVNLSKANLSNSDISGADLTNADLRNASLSGVNLNEADLTGVNLSETDLSNFDLRRINCHRANFREANMKQVDLYEAELIQANMIRVNLLESNLTQANLSKANLSGANLNRVNLSKANLSGANLNGVNFSEANLSDANLNNASLIAVNLSEADLRKVNLIGANLDEANFNESKIDNRTQLDKKWRIVWEIINNSITNRNLQKANLSRANLSKVNLSGANLKEADLRGANLSEANLSNADLSEADLRGANLRKANLHNANLHRTKIVLNTSNKNHYNKITQLDEKWKRIWGIINQPVFGRNLSSFDFCKANLAGVDLTGTNLSKIQALNTNFKNANLTGTCIEDWHINSDTNFDGVICEYIYLKSEIQNDRWIYTDRRPSDPTKTFAPGDFARLIEQSRETVDLIFNAGIDWTAFLNSFQSLQVEGDYGELSIQAIEKKRDGFVVRVEVPQNADKGDIETKFKLKYETELKLLETKYRCELQAKDREIAIYKQQNADILELARLAASRPITVETKAIVDQSKSDRVITIENNEIKGAAYSEETKGPIYTQGNTIYNEASAKSSLAEAAKEIQDLLKQLEATNLTTSTTEQMLVAAEAVKQIESDPTFKQKAINAAKSGTLDFLKQTPIGVIVTAAIESWTNAEEKRSPCKDL